MAVTKQLASWGIRPTLVDVGASGDPPPAWRSIAPSATYVGFDPDTREIQDGVRGGFARHVMVNKAIVADDRATAQFHFTRSPFCSSTLDPDAAALANHYFAPLFEVTGRGEVPAARLDAVLDDLGLECVDWLKLDTQGTDLRIVRSLSRRRLDNLLAVDVEPGLIDAYIGEDLFSTTHEAMKALGFWLGDLTVRGTVRIHEDSVKQLASQGINTNILRHGIRSAPGWAEATYLRTPASLVESGAPVDRFRLLWAFCTSIGHLGAALDTARLAAEAVPGPEADALLQAAEARIRRRGTAAGALQAMNQAGRAIRWARRRLRRSRG